MDHRPRWPAAFVWLYGLATAGLVGLLIFPFVAGALGSLPFLWELERWRWTSWSPWLSVETLIPLGAFCLGVASIARLSLRLNRGQRVSPPLFVVWAAFPFFTACVLEGLAVVPRAERIAAEFSAWRPSPREITSYALAGAAEGLENGAILSGVSFLLAGMLVALLPWRRRARWTLGAVMGAALLIAPLFGAILTSGVNAELIAISTSAVGLAALASVFCTSGPLNVRVARKFVVVTSFGMLFPMFVMARSGQLLRYSLGAHGCGPQSMRVVTRAIIAETLPEHVWLDQPWLVGTFMLAALTAVLLRSHFREMVLGTAASVVSPAVLVLVLGALTRSGMAQRLDERLPRGAAASDGLVALSDTSWVARRYDGPFLVLNSVEPGPELRETLRRHLQPARLEHFWQWHSEQSQPNLTVAPANSLFGPELNDFLIEAERAGAEEIDWVTVDPEMTIAVTDDPRTWVSRLIAHQYLTHSVLVPSTLSGTLYAVVGADADLRLHWAEKGHTDAIRFAPDRVFRAEQVRTMKGLRQGLPVTVVLEVGIDASAQSLISAMHRLQEAGFTTAITLPSK